MCLIVFERGEDMKSIIAEYLPLKDEDKSQLWENCVFVFDTNVLLNLYRYSRETTNALIGAIEQLSPRIWIPYQVASEFMRRRCDVIYDTIEKYSNFENRMQSFITDAKALSNLSDTNSEIAQLKQTLSKWLTKCKEKNLLVSSANNDFILDRLLTLFNNHAGQSYSSEEEKKLFAEGERRYKSQIPPGYMDLPKKVSDTCDNNIYGDFILWNQIIDYSEDKKVGIILVTNDRKEDWWYEVKGKTVGPRTELICEFRTKTKQQFHMYTMDGFLQIYNKNHDRMINEIVIEEVKQNFERNSNVHYSQNDIQQWKQLGEKRFDLLTQISYYEKQLYDDNAKLNMLISQVKQQNDVDADTNSQDKYTSSQVRNLMTSISEIWLKKENLKNELMIIEELYKNR